MVLSAKQAKGVDGCFGLFWIESSAIASGTCQTKVAYTYEWRTKNYLLAMDMAKVAGPLSVVKVCASILSAKVRYQ